MNPNAKRDASKGGKARAKKLTKDQRSQIAREGARALWRKIRGGSFK